MSEHDTKPTEHGAAYNTKPAGLEKWADGVFGKNAPFKMPEGGRAWFANNVWWLALIGGVLSLWAAWSAWQTTRYVSQWSTYLDEAARQLGTPTVGSTFGFTYYLALAAMATQGVLLLMAFQKLKIQQKAGWNLIFYSSLISLVVGVLYLFTPYYGPSSLIGVAIGVAIGWWVLFQIRGKFNK